MERESMENEDEFEFASTETDPSVTADEIFSNGQIRPAYPLFNRDLLLVDDVGGGGGEEKYIGIPLRSLMAENRIRAPLTRSASISSSSSMDDLEGVQPGSYRAWAPKSTPASPDRCKKSRSTGSTRRWRLMDLVLGRSPSDGKEKLVYTVHPKKEDDSRLHPSRDLKMKPSPLHPPLHPTAAVAAAAAKGEVKKGKGVRVKGSEMDLVTAHRIYYGKSGEGQGAEGGRRSFLPYNVSLGLFAGSSNLGRTRHPFG